MPVFGFALLFAHATQRQTLDVFAAASLHEAMSAIATRFEAKNPGVDVRLSFGGSQQLAAQINQGAPCDVFASADERNLDKIAYDPTTKKIFALNRLVVVCPPQSPVSKFRDLANVKLILAAFQVPVGGYSHYALEKASKVFGAAWLHSVEANTVSNEQDVREVLAKIELGEADAGIVYASDAQSAAGKVRSVPVPSQFQPRIAYPIAVPHEAVAIGLAKSFIQAVLSPAGQSELRRRGFTSQR